MAETHSREKETSVPAGAPCPVCATPNEVPEKDARFQCKECGVFSILGPDGVSLEVESESVEALPDKWPVQAKCRGCRKWFAIDPEDSTKCIWCRSRLKHPVKPHVSRRKSRGIILYLILTVLVALVCCPWSGPYSTIIFNLLLFVLVALVACFLSLDPYIYKGK
jgi:hypothetical protein